MKYLFSILALLSAGNVWAGQAEFPKELVGLWVDVRVGCEGYPSNPESGFEIEPKKYLGYEKTCKLKAAPKRKGNTFFLDMICSEEGETHPSDMTLSISADARVLTSGEGKHIRCQNKH